MVTEPIIRIEGCVAEVFVYGAVELVRPAFGCDLHHAPGKATKLGADIVRLHTELLHGVLGRHK